MIEPQPPLPEHLDEARERSLPDDLKGLAADAREYARAELAYQKTRAAYAGKQGAVIAGFGAGALALAFFAMMALVVGAVIALAEVLTPWGSTAVVTGVLLVLSFAFAMIALRRWNRMKTILRESEGEA